MPSSPNKRLREQGRTPKNVRWFLEYAEDITQYFCPFCRQGIFRTQQRVISIIYGEAAEEPHMSMPLSIQCHTCAAMHHLQGFNK